MKTEIELKLRIDPANIPDLYSSSVISSYTKESPVKEKLVSTYFDTANYDLRQNGFALRIREINNKLLQTVKASGQLVGDLHHREEWENEITNQQPDLALISDDNLRAKLQKLIATKPLLALFTTEFIRTSWQLVLPDKTHIELALDQGEIQTKTNSEIISEVELELISGDVTKISKIADQLKQSVPLKVEQRSKADRGFRLYML